MTKGFEISPWPSFTEEEADAVSNVLLSNRVNYWTGTEGRSFEKEFAKFAGTEHAIAVANGTVALDLALHGLAIGSRNGGSESDEVIVSPRSFLASCSTIVNAGAKPVFADVGKDSQNIEPNTVAAVVSPNTRAVICVHLAGWPCDIDGIRSAVDNPDIKLIEDCAQAHGARYKGLPVGCLGDVGGWSFCQDKIITTGGEGGMVTCSDETTWERMWAFKDHGKSWDRIYNTVHPPGFRWVHDSFGTNWRLTEVQSVIGRIQLRKTEEWNRKRAIHAEKLAEIIRSIDADRGFIRVTQDSDAYIEQFGSCEEDNRHAWYRYYAFIQPENAPLEFTRNKIVDGLEKFGIRVSQGTCSEVYLERAFDGTCYRPSKRLDIAKELGDNSLAFMVHPTLTSAYFDRIYDGLTQIYEKF